MTERENLPSKIAAQDVVVTTTQRGSLVERGLAAIQKNKQLALIENNGAISAVKQYRLGLMYDQGAGVPQDYEEAVKWYRLAADQGDAYAQSNLGAMYCKGEGVPQDYDEAVKWFRKAADQGDADGQYNLGAMYDNGTGVSRKKAQAITWYQLAAAQGHAEAQNLLKLHHEETEALYKKTGSSSIAL